MMRNGHDGGRRPRNHKSLKAVSAVESLEQRLFLTAAPTDPYEPNDTAATATNLTNLAGNWLSDMQGRAIASSNDVDWYTIEVGSQAGDPARHVHLYFRSPTAGGRLQVTVYDSTGLNAINNATVQVPVDTSPTSRNASIDLGILQPGTYAVKVVNGGGASAAALSYDMKWDAVIPADDPYEPNNNQAQAYNLDGSAGKWLSQFQGQGRQYDEDWYQFYVPAGYTRVALDLLFKNADGDLRLGLFDSSGVSVASADTLNDGEHLVSVVAAPGWYDAVVSGPDLGTAYDLRWTALPTSDPYGDISTAAKAQDLTNAKGKPLTDVNGWAIVNGQDWYSIPITADTLHLSVQTTTLPGGVYEVDTLTPSTPVQDVWQLTAAATPASGGFFTLMVNGQMTPAIAYNAPAADIQTAINDALGANSVTAVDANGGLAAAGGGTCALSFAAALGPVAVTADVSALVGNSPALTEVTPGAAVAGGTFTITVDGVTTAPINYNATPDSIQQTLESLSILGPGDVTVTGGPANTAPVVMTFQPLLGVPNPTISIDASGLTGGGTISLTNVTQGACPPVHLTLYGSDGTTVAATSSDGSATSVDGNLEADLIIPGTYYVEVTGQTDEAYSLTWNSYAKADAYGDNDYQQTAYDLGSATSGSLSGLKGLGVLADSDYYVLHVASNRPNLYVESLFNGDQGNLNMALYAPDGTPLADPGANEIQTLASTAAGQKVVLTAGAPAATGGTFSITVGTQTASFNYNDTAATIQAGLAALSSVGTGEVTAVDGGGGLGLVGGTCTVSFDPSLGAVPISIDLSGLTGGADTQTITPNTAITGGTYTITVDGHTTAAIAYNADDAAIQTALEALPNIAQGDVTVTGGPLSSAAAALNFSGNLSFTKVNVSVDASAITGGPTITSTETTQGTVPLNQAQTTATGSRIYAQLPSSVLTAGKVYIAFTGGNGGNSYDLKWQSAGPDDAYEPNDTAAAAHDLSSSPATWLSALSGVGVQKNADWYSIPVSQARSHVYVTCGFDTNVGGITMDLLASDGTTPLASAAAVDNGSIISFNVTGASLTAGKVYVRITGSNAGNLYDLEWNSAAAQDAYGDNSTPPGAYDLGDATSGSLSAAAGQAILGTQGFYRLHVDSSHPTLLVDTMFDPNQGNLNVDLLDPNANEVETLAPAPAAEVVKLSTQSAATGGTYTLTVGGQTTSALAYNASAADIQAAMAALSTVGAGNVTATDDPTLGGLAAGGSCTLSFAAGLGALDVTGDFTGLTGTAPTLTEVTHGGVITGGNFTITVDGQTTAPIAYNAASQDIQAALNALSNITAGDVSVTGGPANSAAVVLTFGGKMGLRYVPVSVAIGQLTGGVITAAETHQGGQPLASGSRILMQLPPEVLTAGYCYLRVSPVQLNAQVTSQGIPYDLSWKTGVVGANGQDAFQGPNGIATSSNAYDLSAHKGQWLSDIAGLAILNNQEYFKLAVTAAQPRMLVQARFNASVDPNDFLLQIFAQDGTTELARGTTASGGMAAWAVMPPSVIKAGYCYVLVSSGAGDYMGAAYDLKWDGGVGADQYGANSGGTSVAENDTMQTAYPLPANPQGQWLSQITGKGPAMAIDSHYYRLTLTAGQPRVVVQTQAMAFLGAVTVWLYKSDGTLLAQSQPLPGGALLTTVVGADVMADGACYILITSQTISQTGNVVPKGILYDFSYQTMAADDGSTLNDSLQHARDISGQQDVNIPAISGNASGNDDWYSVTVPANSRLLDASVSDAANLAMTLSLYDNQGTLLESGGFFNGRSSVNDTMPAAGTYVLKAHMDQVGVPYTLHWDAQEAASQILVGAGGASSVKFADADGTNVTVTAAGGGAIVLSFLGGNIASTLSNGVATVTAQAGTLQLDTIDLSSATRQTHITITTDSHGDGRTAVNSIIGDAVVGSFYARTTDVVGQGVSMIANGCISQLTLGAMGTGTAMIMTGSGVTTGLVLNASLFSGNMIAVVGSPIGLMTLGAWVGRGSTLTGQYITRLNVTGLSSVNSLPASLVGANHDAIAAGAMDTDLLMIGKDALGNAIGTATVAGDAQGTWDVTGTTVGNINSIRLNGPQNNWSLEAAGSRVNSLWVRGEFFQNTLNAKSFNLLTLQGNVGLSTLTAWQFTTVNIGGQFVDSKIEATGHTPDSTDNTAVGGVIRNLTVNGNMTGATITAQQMGTALITGNVSYTAWSVTGHTAATTTDVSAPGLILGLTVKGNVTGSTVTAQQMVTALITGNLDTTTWQVTGHTATTSGDTNAVGLLGSLTVNGNITSSALTAGHDPSATDTTARLGGFGRIVVNGNISSSTLAAAGSSLLSDDRRYTGLASLMAGRISESNISIAGGIGSFNAIDWSDAVAHGHSLTAGWVRSLIVHGGTGAAGNLQPDVSIADYLQSASIRGQLSSLILINDTLPPLVGDALGSLVAGSIQDANIAVGGTGGIGSITTSQWLKTGVANNVSATYLKSLVAYHGNMQANLSIHDYIGTLSVSGLLKGSAVQAQNRISSVVVGGAENSSIFVGSFTGTDTLGAGGTPDGVFDLPSVSDVWAAETPSTGSPNPGQGHLLRLIVTGAAKDGGYSFINTNIAAIKMDSITIVHPDESPNAVAFGLAGDTISALSITDSHGRHTWRMLLSSGQAPAPLAKLEVRVA